MSTGIETVERVAPAPRRIGRHTIVFTEQPQIRTVYAIGGRMEAEGPCGPWLDVSYDDPLLGEKSWEMAETRLLQEAILGCCAQAGLEPGDVEALIAGDLLNQVVSSTWAAREVDIPFVGIFGACSTFTLGLGLAGIFVDAGYAGRVVAACSSHHEAAERQYRFPTELGGQRPPTAQWTATGAVAALITSRDAGAAGDATAGTGVVVSAMTIGRVIDAGVKNPFDMGTAMAPAAADTILRHFQDTGRSPADYDVVATGDLAGVGHPIAAELLREQGLELGDRFMDCGKLLYEPERQDVHAGGSGCACSGIVFRTQFFPRLLSGGIKRMLLVSTGALHNSMTAQQGESMPCIAHAVTIERVERP